MYFTVYQITNSINGKIYIGCHRTKKLDDHYFGSSSILKTAIRKYGKQNFVKEILFTYDNPEDMYAKENEIVTEEFVARNDTYNAKVGGVGGWEHINNGSNEHLIRCRKAGEMAKHNIERYNEECRLGLRTRTPSDNLRISNEKRKKIGLSEEHKNKIRIAALKNAAAKRAKDEAE